MIRINEIRPFRCNYVNNLEKNCGLSAKGQNNDHSFVLLAAFFRSLFRLHRLCKYFFFVSFCLVY